MLAAIPIVVQDDLVDAAGAERDRVAHPLVPPRRPRARRWRCQRPRARRGDPDARRGRVRVQAHCRIERRCDRSRGRHHARPRRSTAHRSREYLDTIDYSRFVAKRGVRRALGVLGDLEHLVVDLGIHDGAYLVEWLGDVLDDIGVTTFGDLAIDDPARRQPPAGAALLARGPRLGHHPRQVAYASPGTTPSTGSSAEQQRIVDAVRASMSIPFFFTPVHVDALAAEVNGQTFRPRSAPGLTAGCWTTFRSTSSTWTDGTPGVGRRSGSSCRRKATAALASKSTATFEEALACLYDAARERRSLLRRAGRRRCGRSSSTAGHQRGRLRHQTRRASVPLRERCRGCPNLAGRRQAHSSQTLIDGTGQRERSVKKKWQLQPELETLQNVAL